MEKSPVETLAEEFGYRLEEVDQVSMFVLRKEDGRRAEISAGESDDAPRDLMDLCLACIYLPGSREPLIVGFGKPFLWCIHTVHEYLLVGMPPISGTYQSSPSDNDSFPENRSSNQ